MRVCNKASSRWGTGRTETEGGRGRRANAQDTRGVAVFRSNFVFFCWWLRSSEPQAGGLSACRQCTERNNHCENVIIISLCALPVRTRFVRPRLAAPPPPKKKNRFEKLPRLVSCAFALRPLLPSVSVLPVPDLDDVLLHTRKSARVKPSSDDKPWLFVHHSTQKKPSFR